MAVNIEELKAENQRLKQENANLKDKKIAQLQQKIVQMKEQEIKPLKQRIFELEQRQKELLRLIFTGKSERHIPKNQSAKEQLAFDFDFGELAPVDMEAGADLKEEKEKITYERKKKKHPGRHPIPNHLPVEEIRIEPEDSTEDTEYIADTIVETLEYKPGSLIRKRYIFPRYAKTSTNEEGEASTKILQGKMPSRPLPKSIAESGLLTHLIVSKFVYHLPFYRQIQQFKQLYNTELRKSTINDWFIAVCTLLQPLYQCLQNQVLTADYLQADESPLQVQDDQKKGKTHRGYQWVYYAPLLKLVLFDYQKGRGQNGPKSNLKDFSGYLQTDGYVVYDKIVKNRTDIIQVGCMAHVRRYFFQAKDSEPLAEKALDYFRQLYFIEKQLREQKATPEQILNMRKEKSLPILDDLFEWATRQYPKALPKSNFGKALYYLLQRKEKLQTYCTDSRINIDNNLVENSIRPLALGRKNYLFAGSHPAAQRIAMMYSFFATCKKNEVNPVQWLKAVLDKIADHPINRIEELLPGKWCEKETE